MKFRQFRAVLADSFLEHRDRKVNYFLLACSAFAALVLSSLALRVATPQETVANWTTVLPGIGRDYRPDLIARGSAAPVAGPVAVARTPARTERWEFDLRYPFPESILWSMEWWNDSDKGRSRKGAAHAASRHLDHMFFAGLPKAFERAASLFPETAGATGELVEKMRGLARRWRELDRPDVSATAADEERYLVERMESFGFRAVRALKTGLGLYRLSLEVPFPLEAVRVHDVRVLWTYTLKLDEIYSYAHVLGAIQRWLVDVAAGFFGILVALLVTAGGAFAALQKGAVEIVVAKPVSRPFLLLSKYASGCVFIAFHAAAFLGAGALALAAGTGHFNGAVLWGVALVTVFYAILYAPVLFVAVVARSGSFAPAVGIGVWLISAQIADLHRLGLRTLYEEIPPFWEGVVRTLFWIFPKTSAIKEYGLSRLADGLSPELARTLDLVVKTGLPAPVAFGTSALFALFFLALACRCFARKDP